jgi:hypothetical protein
MNGMRTVIILFFAALSVMSYAQEVSPEKQKALDLLNNAFGGLGESESYAVYFEGIAYGISDPKDIFSLPADKVFRGGHVFNYGKKYEMSTGDMKVLCDGKLVVIANEIERSMMIDSLRDIKEEDMKTNFDLNKMLGVNFEELDISYEGKGTLNKKECHKIKTFIPGQPEYTTYYWIDAATERIYLMAEKNGNNYDAYWVSRIGKSPAKYSYDIHIPAKQITQLYGYEVFDLRFIPKK